MAKNSKKSKKNDKKRQIFLFSMVIMLLMGAVVGYFIGKAVIKNDEFVIIGNDVVEIYVGQTYQDEGAKAISFGKDISSKIETESNLNQNEEGQYYIKYTVNNIRYKGVERYRTIIVKALPDGEAEVQNESI